MVKLDRTLLMKIHMLLAAFILPVAIMFFITGGLYTWGVKGGYNTVTHMLRLEQPLQSNLPILIDLVTKELKQRDIPKPSGDAKIKNVGISFQVEWTGSNLDVILESTQEPLVASLTIKETNWYQKLVQLHKAKGGIVFKIYASSLASALLTLLITGFLMAWQMPKYRKLTLASIGSGIAIFITMVLAS